VADFQLNADCRHVRWDRPCTPHKQRGKVCQTCDEYDPVRHRVLMVKLAAPGDVLRTTALLPAVHKAFAAARVSWLTRPNATALLRGNAMVDEVLSTDDAVTSARLSTETFDVVLCPDADPDAAALAASARGQQRRGFTRDQQGHVVPLGPAAEHWFAMGLSDSLKKANTRTYQALVAEVLGLDPTHVGPPMLEPSAPERAAAEALRARTGFAGPLIGLNTGAGARWPYKQWTGPHQETFLRLMASKGRGVLLLGGPEEESRHRQLLAAARGLPVFDGGNRNSYGAFAALVELCAVVVTGDTLALHVACARKVPAVVLFGPTSSAEIELYGRGTKVLPEGLDCLCCYLPRCDKQPYCMQLIAPEVVAAAVERWLPVPHPR
jgi:ADP-heptose:LPS heptosyltransferase